MQYLELAKSYRQDFIEDLKGLVRIPSVRGEGHPGMPYGKACYEVLRYMLELGQKMGFHSVDVDGYMGYCEYGTGPELLLIICHLDVVPAGDGWFTSPYEPYLVEGDLLRGRGVSDNKGAGMAALYTLKALKELGVTGKMRVRALFGCNEESGMTDIEYYLRKEGQPAVALVPDAGYPIYNRQRGGLRCQFSVEEDCGGLLEFRSADSERRATALLDLETLEVSTAELFARAVERQREFGENGMTLQVAEMGGDRAKVTLSGAGGLTVTFLQLLDGWFPGKLGQAVGLLANRFRPDGTNALQGISAPETADFGMLTVLLQEAEFTRGTGSFSTYLRIPANASVDLHRQVLCENFPAYPATILTSWPSHYVPESHPATQLLAASYEEETGKPVRYLCNVGGNYSRFIDVGYAYGNGFDGDPPARSHGPNEQISIDSLLRHMALHIAAVKKFMEEYEPPARD